MREEVRSRAAAFAAASLVPPPMLVYANPMRFYYSMMTFAVAVMAIAIAFAFAPEIKRLARRFMRKARRGP